MFVTRKIGSLLRGKATRGQVFLAALLAGVLGFVPGFFLTSDLGGGFAQAPALILSVLFLALALNANLGVFGLVTVLAKLASIPLLPVAFAIGRALLDGPLQPLFRVMVNAPVFAWFGLEYYATTGGLVLGLFFGTAAGLLFASALMSFRRRMAKVEETSATYQKHSGKPLVRFLTWLLFGKGKGKKLTWQELAESERRGLPVRITGLVVIALLVAGMWAFQQQLSKPVLTDGLRNGLRTLNGASVDLAGAEIDLAAGSLRLDDLAIADSKALDHDVFAARQLEARIDTVALLRKRLVIDTLKAAGATSGHRRATPGVLEPQPPPPPPPPADATQKTIDDYLKDVEVWKQRLQQVRDWIEKLAGTSEPPAETPEEQRRRIDDAAQRYGLAKVSADHLREDLPFVLIRTIDIEGIDAPNLSAQPVDLHVKNLSTNAWLLTEPPRFSLKSADGALSFACTGPSQARKGAALELSLKDLPVDAMMARLKTGGSTPVRGGQLDLSINGSLLTHGTAATTVDLPLQVALRDTTIALAGAKETRIDRLLLPIGLRGPVDSLTVAFDDKALADALVAAGKQELAQFVQSQAGRLLGKVPGAEGLIDPNKSVQQNLDDARKVAEEAAKKAAADAEAAAKKAAEDAAKKAAEDAAKKAAGNALKGLLPGKKN